MNARKTALSILIAFVASLAVGAFSAHAERIANAVAVFAALDKVTGRVSPLEIKMGQTMTFGALKVTAKA